FDALGGSLCVDRSGEKEQGEERRGQTSHAAWDGGGAVMVDNLRARAVASSGRHLIVLEKPYIQDKLSFRGNHETLRCRIVDDVPRAAAGSREGRFQVHLEVA